jgi:hypothetical protein
VASNARLNRSASATTSAGSNSETTGSGDHGPTYSTRLRSAERRRSIANRVTTVVRNAAGERTAERSASCQRANASCTTSSASAIVPSIALHPGFVLTASD